MTTSVAGRSAGGWGISQALHLFATAILGCVVICIAGAAAANAPSATSAAEVIHDARLAEPLVRAAPTTAKEDADLARALDAYRSRGRPDDSGALTSFLARYPRSGWAPSLLTSLGLSYLHDGYFSRAIDAWKSAWELGEGATDPGAKAEVDRAVGELARLYAGLGQFDNLKVLFDEIGRRPISGSATEAVQNAREALGLVTRDPRHLFNCGPVALELLIQAENPHDLRGTFLQGYRAGPRGTSFAELRRLANKAGFSSRLVLRRPGQSVPTPAIVHWKLGHFATIIGKANGRYHVEDPVFPGSGLWVTQAALDAEASGYFLVPASVSTSGGGWRGVGVKEASGVWGKGPTFGTALGDAFDALASALGGCPLCEYNIKESAVGLTLSDRPVGYTPPIGPSAKVRITYNQREDSQPAVFGFFNVSPKWTLNWLTYITDDPTNPGANVSRYLSGGGAYYYSAYSSATARFAAQPDDGSILVLASRSPVVYRRQLADGGVEIYAQSNGAASYPRDIFLSQVIDPQGNAITLNYDSRMRLVSLTDATGRQTTFSYGVVSEPLLVTEITDPFGRAATLTYDSSGRLSSITDILGLKSSFTYDANSLVDAMSTPYGTTTFAYTAPGSSGPPRFLQITDPLGYSEREEWLEPAPIPDSDPAASVPAGMPIALTNQYLSYRDSFHWDKNAYVVAGCTPTGDCDYTKARDLHFNHVPNTSIKSTSIGSVKYPLENRVWYVYPGQSNSIYAGAYNQPIAAGRVLDDGTTQLSQFSYDTSGYFNQTQKVDPLGRVTSYVYANQIDLAAASQTTANGFQSALGQWIHNTQHLPTFHTDAAYETTSFAYNQAGQLSSATSPLGQTTTNHYNATGDLTSIVNANGVTQGLGAGGCLGAAGLGLEEGAAAEAAPAFAGAEALVAPLLSGPALDVASALGEAMAAADAADAGAGIGAGLADDAADAAAGAAADSAAADAGAGIGADIGAGTSADAAAGAADATSISTPYAVEVQSSSAGAQSALEAVQNGAPLYRAGQLGESMAGESQYWSLESPMSPGYAERMGMPNVAPDFVLQGSLNPGASVITNGAPGLGSSAGGGIQIVTSPGGVGSLGFTMP